MHLLFLAILQGVEDGGVPGILQEGLGLNTSQMVVPCCTVGIFSCWLMYLYLVNK